MDSSCDPYEDTLNGGTGSSVLSTTPGRDNTVVWPTLIGGMSDIGGSNQDPYQIVQNKFGGGDDLSLALGKHNLRMGEPHPGADEHHQRLGHGRAVGVLEHCRLSF